MTHVEMMPRFSSRLRSAAGGEDSPSKKPKRDNGSAESGIRKRAVDRMNNLSGRSPQARIDAHFKLHGASPQVEESARVLDSTNIGALDFNENTTQASDRSIPNQSLNSPPVTPRQGTYKHAPAREISQIENKNENAPLTSLKTHEVDLTYTLQVYRVIKTKSGTGTDENKYTMDDGAFLEPGSLNKELDQHPLTMRRVFADRNRHVKTAVKINSPAIVDVLRNLFPGARSALHTRLAKGRTSIHAPYVSLFHNRHLLLEAITSTKRHHAEHINLLLDFMKEEQPTTWETMELLVNDKCEQVSFFDMWLLYPPGMTVYRKENSHWTAFRVENVVVQHIPDLEPLSVRCYGLQLDNPPTRLIPYRRTFQILPFFGKRSIKDLAIVPNSHVGLLHLERDLQQELFDRGTMYWDFRNEPAYREYTGGAWPRTQSSDDVKVMIDYKTHSKHDPIAQRSISSHVSNSNILFDQLLDNDCDCSFCAKKYAALSAYPELDVDDARICINDRWPASVASRRPLDENRALIFCPSRVWAYSLKHKSWREVEVAHLRHVHSEERPFCKLVLEDSKKNMIESLVDAYVRNLSFSDIVKEKGRGLVILLHGAPGTGKTLTAECVAAKTRRPLYMITCGDLGTEPDQLEQRLQDVFRLAIDWKAILVLDEADVFLQERDLYDLRRNALVSIFLRHLEYFDGLLFLTTNRPGQIDEAFQSRIHVTLGLPDLNYKHQAEVWDIFLEDLDIESDRKREIQDFVRSENGLPKTLKRARYRMNGREIRNCMRSATALAHKNGRKLEKSDVLAVVDMSMTFRNYMKRLNGRDLAEKMEASGARMQKTAPKEEEESMNLYDRLKSKGEWL